MISYFRCYKCKKLITKKPKRIGNTVYIANHMHHKHAETLWACMRLSKQDFYYAKEKSHKKQKDSD